MWATNRRLLAMRETFLDKEQEEAVLLVLGLEERANVTITAEPHSREGDRPFARCSAHTGLRHRYEVPRDAPRSASRRRRRSRDDGIV